LDGSFTKKICHSQIINFQCDFNQWRGLIANISGTHQGIISRKTALRTMISPTYMHLVWWTFVHQWENRTGVSIHPKVHFRMLISQVRSVASVKISSTLENDQGLLVYSQGLVFSHQFFFRNYSSKIGQFSVFGLYFQRLRDITVHTNSLVYYALLLLLFCCHHLCCTLSLLYF